MVRAQVRQLDPAARRVVLGLEDGRQVTVTLPPGANIEVVGPATLGTIGGTLEDLKVGYWVDAEIHEQRGVEVCACTSLVCLS